MRYSHVVFDIDGTMTDTEKPDLVSFQRTIKEVTGKDIPWEELRFAFGIPGADALKQMKMELSALEIWNRHMRSFKDEIELFPGIREILEVLDTCVSCKACKSECPSNVDIARFKAEFLQQHYDVCGVPMKAFLIARLTEIQRLGTILPWFYNAIVRNRMTGNMLKRILHFAPKRTIPILYKTTLKHWLGRYRQKNRGETVGKVFLFADEFTNYMDVEIGIKMIELLDWLGYEVIIPKQV